MADLPRGVLFDFSGTLFHVESARAAVLAALGPDYLDRVPDLERLGAINGSRTPIDLPADLADVWAERDLSHAAHRAAYSGLAERAGLSAEEAGRLYARGLRPEAWHSFPDTNDVLRRLREASVPVALVSNIGWDPRPVLRHHGVADLFDRLVLSDERGMLKPDPRLFWAACTELGVDSAEAVMVGDDPVNDAGAADIGCRFVLVPSSPSRPHDTLLRAVGFDAVPTGCA